MDFKILQNQLAFALNFNDGQTDQDFTTARLKQALNLAYAREVYKAQQEGSKRYWKDYRDISWPASQVTLVLPASVARKNVIRIMDVTSSQLGNVLLFSENGLHGDVFWLNKTTLQWGVSGPGEAKTLRVFYIAAPVDMVDDSDEPTLVPDAFHELIVWSAACWCRTIADEEAPNAWLRAREDLQLDFWKYVSRGRPHDDEPTIGARDSDYSEEVISA